VANCSKKCQAGHPVEPPFPNGPRLRPNFEIQREYARNPKKATKPLAFDAEVQRQRYRLLRNPSFVARTNRDLLTRSIAACSKFGANIFKPFIVPPPVAWPQLNAELVDGIFSVGGLPHELVGVLVEPAMSFPPQDINNISWFVFLSLRFFLQAHARSLVPR
jgi:hypothetical protein